MQNTKKKVVWWSNSPLARTGLGRNTKSVLNYLYKTGKFEICCYCMGQQEHPDFQKLPYKMIASIPSDPAQIQYINSNPQLAPSVGYGGFLLDQMVKNEKPDFLIMSDDFWSGTHTSYYDKPWFNKFHTVVHTTLDSEPLLPDAIRHADKIKHYFVWADFAQHILNDLGHSHVKTITGAIDPAPFYKLSLVEKANLREKFNIPADSFIVMMTSRNQLRKEFPALMEGFATFRKQNPECKNSYLLLHTHVPEAAGWDIPRLMDEHGIKDNVLFTYICKSCQNINVQIYQGQDIDCPHCRAEKSLITCNIGFGCSEEELNNVYNLADCYCHPANAAGLELGLIEALYCELPIATCAYSGTTMFTKNDFCSKIEFSWGRQVGTNFKRAVPYASSITKFLTKIFKLPLNKRQELGRAGRRYGLETFSPEVVGKQWEDFLDSLEPTNYDFNFDQIRKNDAYPFNQDISDDCEWITDLYKNILLCDPDPDGLKNWTDGLKHGRTREQIYEFFIETAKKQNAESGQNEVKLEDLFPRVDNKKNVVLVLKESLGDHVIFSSLLPEIYIKYPLDKHSIYLCCDPKYFTVYDGNSNIKLVNYHPAFDNEMIMIGSGSNNGLADYYHLIGVSTQKVLNYLSGDY